MSLLSAMQSAPQEHVKSSAPEEHLELLARGQEHVLGTRATKMMHRKMSTINVETHDQSSAVPDGLP